MFILFFFSFLFLQLSTFDSGLITIKLWSCSEKISKGWEIVCQKRENLRYKSLEESLAKMFCFCVFICCLTLLFHKLHGYFVMSVRNSEQDFFLIKGEKLLKPYRQARLSVSDISNKRQKRGKSPHPGQANG